MVTDPRAESVVALLVEDNPADAELITVRLESTMAAGNSTRVRLMRADSAAAACSLLRQATVDVVILDLTLRDARGLEALHRVRAASSDVPIIVLTGVADQALAVEALRAGAQDYVLKPPPDGSTLRRILRYARERQHLLGELDAARRVSASAAQRWRLLAKVSEVLAATSEPGLAASRIGRLIVPEVADCCVLYLTSDEGAPPVVEVAHVHGPPAGELRARIRALLTTPGAPGDRLLRATRAVDSSSTGELGDALRSVFASLGVASGSAVPLRFVRRTFGLLVLAVTAGRRDAAADAGFGQSLAERIGLALEQARLLQQARRAFRQTQRAVAGRDRAVGIVSHDLGNPLSTIEICAAALLDPAPPPLGGIRHMAQIIQRSAASMRRIMQDLLDRASLDAGRLALERRPTVVSDVIGAAQIMFTPIAEEQAVEFVVESASDLPWIDADPQRLTQVISNLLSNAMKFTPSGGRVVLSARLGSEGAAGGPGAAAVAAGGAVVCFTVSDTGPGIPAEDQSHIFDWFWQSRRERREGTGLGLAIARGLIEAHRGRLYVESIPGRGSTFWFTLPAVSRDEAGAATSPPQC